MEKQKQNPWTRFICPSQRAQGNSVAPTLQTEHLKFIDVHWSLLYKRDQKQSLAVLSGWIPLPKYLDTYPCDSWKKQWSNLCLHSGRRHSVCEIYVNKRYCFCTEINLAWFPSIHCMRRHLAANHLWMHGRMRVRGSWSAKMKQTPQEPEFCNSVDRFVCLYICFVMVCLNLTWVSTCSKEQICQKLNSVTIHSSRWRCQALFFYAGNIYAASQQNS